MPAPPDRRCQFETDVEASYFDPESESLFDAVDGAWRCPHHALEADGVEYCPFHVPTDRRPGTVRDEHLAETLLRLVRGPSADGVGFVSLPDVLGEFLDRTHGSDAVTPAERTRFVGATFGALALDYRVLDAPTDAPLDFREATFAGPVSIDDAEIGQEVTFDGATFEADVRFEETTFLGRAKFRETTFREGADFHHAAFDSWARFDDAEFRGEANFRGVEFDHGILANGARFESAADFMAAVFHAVAHFSDSVFHHGAVFSSTRFHGNATFRRTTFRSPVALAENFVDITDIDDRWRHISVVDRRVPGSAVVFRNLTCHGRISLEDATVEGDVHVASSRLDGDLLAPNLTVATDDLRVNLAGTETVSGEIDTEHDAIQYDLTAATAGELDIPENGIAAVTFDRTTFDGFDFGQYKESLAEHGWLLHGEDDERSPRQLENLYLRAKNGAAEIGENRAASRFFGLEMSHRRRAHRAAVLSSSGLLARARALFRWLSNVSLWLTSGYGEAPTRPVAFSAVVIGAFSVVYFLTDAPIPYRTPLGYLTFSSEAFVALVLGKPQTTGIVLSSVVAFEGFLGGFMIAVFVFTLTRSVDR